MKKLHYLLITINLLFFNAVFAQEVLLYEGFESGSLPMGWDYKPIKQNFQGNTVLWQYVNGGHPTGTSTSYPDTAAVGNYNATFYYDSFNNEATMLYSPKINLVNKLKPQLTFMQIAKKWDFPNNWDKLRVYYKKTNTWVLMEEFLNPVEDWTKRTLVIPDEAISDSFRIAFEGTTGYGHGVCIDEIQIKESEVASRIVSDYKVTNALVKSVATGTKNNPILRIHLYVYGNINDCILQQIKLKSLNSDNNDVALNGVKLFYTRDSIFNLNTPITAGSSFVGSSSTISTINKKLLTGDNYIWVTFDISENAIAENIIDAMIEPNGIVLNTNTIPADTANPAGFSQVVQSIFFDNFETAKGWLFTNEFQRAKPIGLGASGANGSPDPTYAFSGEYVIGNDLNYSASLSPGGLESYLGEKEEQAVSPAINCYFYKDIQLNLQQWLNSSSANSCDIDISNDNGESWVNIFQSAPSFYKTEQWTNKSYDISKYANRKKEVKIRFSAGSTYFYNLFSGWNIDDLLVYGSYVSTDIGVERFVSPQNGTNLSNNEKVKVVVRNYGAFNTPNRIPLTYYFNNGKGLIQTATDTLVGVLTPGDSAVFEFKKGVDLSQSGIYRKAYVAAMLNGDQYFENDTLFTDVLVVPTETVPYAQGFENDESFWFVNNTYAAGTHPTSSWELGSPIGDVINKPAEGNKSWITDLDYIYKANDSTFVVSPYFNLTTALSPMVEFKYWSDLEENSDGVKFQYSTDKGKTWKTMMHDYPYLWNWQDTTEILSFEEKIGWTGRTYGWKQARQIIPSDAISTGTKFRFLLGTDPELTLHEGFAFDDFKIINARPDIMAVDISSPITSCELTDNEKISVVLKNKGFRKIKANDTIVIGAKVNDYPIQLDTIKITSDWNANQDRTFTMQKGFDMEESGSYNITAFFIYPDDQNIYSDSTYNNDTVKTSIVVKKPKVDLGPDIYTVQPDTVVLNAYSVQGLEYTWQDATKDSVYKVTQGGVYTVIVTDNSVPCSAYDTVIVHKLIADLAITALDNPTDACHQTDTVPVTISILNNGTDTVLPGIAIKLSYAVTPKNGAKLEYTQDFVFADTLLPQQTFQYQFAQRQNMINWNEYQFEVSVLYAIDDSSQNNNLATIVNVWGDAKFDLLPNDTVIAGMTYRLNAAFNNSNIVAYQWNDGTSDSVVLVEYPGRDYYTVTVTDIHGCTKADSSQIFLVIPDLTVELIEPVEMCGAFDAKSVKVWVKNIGTYEIPQGDTIDLSYNINNDLGSVQQFELPKKFAPRDSFQYSFPQIITLNPNTSFTINCSVHLFNDSVPSNDTVIGSYNVYPQAVVELGPDTTIRAPKLIINPGDFVAYKWHNDSTYPTHTVDIAKTISYENIKVTVTDANGCTASDARKVTISLIDLAVKNYTIPDTTCGIFSDNPLGVVFYNSGNYTLNDDVYLTIFKDNEKLKTDTFKLKGLYPGFTYTHYPKDIIINNAAMINLKAILTMKNDEWGANDSLVKEILVNEAPILDWGAKNDTLKVKLPYLITFPSKYTYLWKDSITDSEREITNIGWNVVTVTTDENCVLNDSVFVQNTIGVRQLLNSGMNVTVYPNPADDYLDITINAAKSSRLTIGLYSEDGKLIKIKQLQLERGRINTSLNISDVSSGVYILRLENQNGEIKTEKIVVR